MGPAGQVLERVVLVKPLGIVRAFVSASFADMRWAGHRVGLSGCPSLLAAKMSRGLLSERVQWAITRLGSSPGQVSLYIEDPLELASNGRFPRTHSWRDFFVQGGGSW